MPEPPWAQPNPGAARAVVEWSNPNQIEGALAVPIGKTVLALAAISAALVAYIGIAGSTGFCPMCTGIVDSVLGKDSGPAGRPETLAGLTATSLSGESVALDSFVGQPVILDFWATWCGPCNTQRTILAGMESELAGKVHVVALSTDNGAAVVQKHIDKTGHGAEHELLASADLQRAFGVSSIPTLVFVDAQGKVRRVAVGVQSAEVLRREIAALN